MTLTRGHGPLAGDAPTTVNYTLDGPAHKLLLHPFPRRVRGAIAGETVIDTERGALLHETHLGPVLYVPEADVRAELLEDSATSTHCPFKGDASYVSVRVGDREVADALWTYRDPTPAAEWLRGLYGVWWDRWESWWDEEEPIAGHLRDPYHRIDVRPSARHVRVTSGDEVIAETRAPKVLSETGLPNRLYLPPADVREELLVATQTRSHCPYKGDASYRGLRDGQADVAWLYPAPFAEALGVAGHLCFDPARVRVEVDGAVLA